MTIDEMRKRLRENCEKYSDCSGCPLFGRSMCDWGITDDHSVIAKGYEVVFPTPRIKDSGERREFETGAVRDIQEGKGRCDLMPLDVVGDFLSNDILRCIGSFQQSGDVRELAYALSMFDAYEPYTMMLDVAKHFEEGAKKYGEVNGVPNWKLGIPVKCYIDSAVRHYLKWLRGDNDEPHDRAFVWNVLACWWTCIHKPELNDYGKSM